MPGLNDAVAPSDFRNKTTCFTVDNTTTAKVLVEATPAAAAAGNLPAYYGGASVIDLFASSTDAAAADINLYFGEVLTTQDGTNTGAMAATATTNGTITRASGSFIADGWKIGDTVMMFAPDSATPNASCDGISGVLTGVAALTLTISGTTWSAVASLASATRIVRVAKWMKANIPANAGNDSTTPKKNVGLINHGNDASALKTEKKLGSNVLLLGAMAANLSAKPATVAVTATFARY